MLTVNPIKLNIGKSHITFGNNTNVTPNRAILALQCPNAKREFEGNLDNVMPSNPLSNFAKKIARTYKYVVSSTNEQPIRKPNQRSNHYVYGIELSDRLI